MNAFQARLMKTVKPSPDDLLVQDLPWCYRWLRILVYVALVPFLMPIGVFLAPGHAMSVFLGLVGASIASNVFQQVMILQIMLKLDRRPSSILYFNFLLLLVCLAKDFLLVFLVFTFRFEGPG